jgi:hypothetical protein
MYSQGVPWKCGSRWVLKGKKIHITIKLLSIGAGKTELNFKNGKDPCHSAFFKSLFINFSHN